MQDKVFSVLLQLAWNYWSQQIWVQLNQQIRNHAHSWFSSDPDQALITHRSLCLHMNYNILYSSVSPLISVRFYLYLSAHVNWNTAAFRFQMKNYLNLFLLVALAWEWNNNPLPVLCNLNPTNQLLLGSSILNDVAVTDF